MTPKLLHIIPHSDFYPPKNGGALRCYYLNQQLAKYFEVTLLTWQDKDLFNPRYDIKWNQNIRIINPIKKVNTNGLLNKVRNALKYRIYKKSLFGPAELVLLSFYNTTKNLLEYEEFDYIVFEHLVSMELSVLIKRKNPSAIQIIDQHNVDHILFKQNKDLKKRGNLKLYNKIKMKESTLYKKVDCFLCCSEKDKNTFNELNINKINGFVIPNGTQIPNSGFLKKIDELNRNIIFCGSLNYEPNIEGLLWFYKKIWNSLRKRLPELNFTIIGKGYSKKLDTLKNDPNINLIGEVESVVTHYQKATLAIVPLFSGSGTRLKILEAMALNTPVISTTVGAEGIKYTNNINILISDEPNHFLNSVIDLLNNKHKRLSLSKNALMLVEENYSWEKIGNDLKEIIIGL